MLLILFFLHSANEIVLISLAVNFILKTKDRDLCLENSKFIINQIKIEGFERVKNLKEYEELNLEMLRINKVSIENTHSTEKLINLWVLHEKFCNLLKRDISLLSKFNLTEKEYIRIQKRLTKLEELLLSSPRNIEISTFVQFVETKNSDFDPFSYFL